MPALLFWALPPALLLLAALLLRKRLFARFYDPVTARYEEYIAPRRQRLLAGLHGTVLEIGPGTGANLPYLDSSVRWIGVEPNPHMRSRLIQRAAELGLEVEFREPEAARLPAQDASVDVVLSSLVLCSLRDPQATLGEIRRVLKPGGRFVFLEHVAAPDNTLLRRNQDLVRPLWQLFADGCRVNRELGTMIRGAGFSRVDMEAFRAPREIMPAMVSPQIAGVAVK